MNRHVNSIAGRLSLRPPQRQSLEILDRITEIVPPSKNADLAAALATIRSEFPTVTDFEREFCSLCFALATGVGKTRLMGAFISYLHLAHGFRNFFVLAPNLTIYNKLITDFTANTPKYVFKGIAEFATDPPAVVTGDNYEAQGAMLSDLVRCRVNVFNISKINSEVRGGHMPRIKRLSEYIGESYFDYLAGLPDLVLIMDESHRYRASAGVRAINELKPVLGLELTATPFVESARGPAAFKNVVFDYPLSQAMIDGFVKEPAVVTRKDFDPAGMSDDAIERMKLEDGVRMHEEVKVELQTYALQSGRPVVKPFMLVIARDTTHAGELVRLMDSTEFFGGAYAGKVIQVDSSRTGTEADEVVQRLLRVEHADEPTEIVVHVNMLKEGWDVTNLYTIVPLRAANARTLIEQSIGRGLRLPYGVRTGVATVDRLNIVAHDRFQEIVDEANRPDSAIRLAQVVLTPERLAQRPATVTAQPVLDRVLGLADAAYPVRSDDLLAAPAAVFTSPADVRAARVVLDQIRRLERQPSLAPTLASLESPAAQAHLVAETKRAIRSSQLALDGLAAEPDVERLVATTTRHVIDRSIGVPRIIVLPKGEVRRGFEPFQLDLSALRYQKVSDELLAQHLRTGKVDRVAAGPGGPAEKRDEDYVVRQLVDFDDLDYGAHADLLYGLAVQVVTHLRSYLSVDDARNVLKCYERPIAELIHTQMQAHAVESAGEYVVEVTGGFEQLAPQAFTVEKGSPVLNMRHSPADRSNMSRYVFGGFERCLYDVQKFDSDSERRLAVVLDRDSLKWCRPAAGQFRITYQLGPMQHDYRPDFVAEGADCIYLIEAKAANEMQAPEVTAKRDAAVVWCRRATEYAEKHGAKPWVYVLIPHDAIAENMSLGWLADRFRQ